MKSFLWTQFSLPQADSGHHSYNKSHTDGELFTQTRLEILYEVNLLSENAIVEVPYPAIEDVDNKVCDQSKSGAIFIAVYETIQIFDENGLVKKISMNSNICGLSILKVNKHFCTVLASTYSGDFLLCEIEMKKSNVKDHDATIGLVKTEVHLNIARGNFNRTDSHDYSCVKLQLIVVSGDPHQRPLLPFCDNMVYIPRRINSQKISVKSSFRSIPNRENEELSPISFLGYHRIYGCQLLQSVETVDSSFRLAGGGGSGGRGGGAQDTVGGGLPPDLGPRECVSAGVLDRIANCRIITPIRGM